MKRPACAGRPFGLASSGRHAHAKQTVSGATVRLEVEAAGNAGRWPKTQLDASHRSEAALRLSIAEAVVQVVGRKSAEVVDRIPRTAEGRRRDDARGMGLGYLLVL